MKSADTRNQNIRIKIDVDHDKCISCGACLDVCPFMVYELKGYEKGGKRKRRIPVPVNIDDCVFCEACKAQCPTDAITIEG